MITNTKNECQGLIFKANISHYHSNPDHRHLLNYNIQLQLAKKISCPGCAHCGWAYEYFEEISMDACPVGGIEKAQPGKYYRLEGVFSHADVFGSATEFDMFELRELQ